MSTKDRRAATQGGAVHKQRSHQGPRPVCSQRRRRSLAPAIIKTETESEALVHGHVTGTVARGETP